MEVDFGFMPVEDEEYEQQIRIAGSFETCEEKMKRSSVLGSR